MQVRRLGPDDADQAHRLDAEAFGGSRRPAPPPPVEPAPGRHEWGAFDGTRLLARS